MRLTPDNISAATVGARNVAKVRAAFAEPMRAETILASGNGAALGRPFPETPLPDLRAPAGARKMNKTEKRFEQWLEVQKARKLVAWYEYEGVTLRLADNTRYTPDFVAIVRRGAELLTVVYEVKGGFIREDAWVKLKIAADLYPWQFVRAVWDKGSWTLTPLPGLAGRMEGTE